MAQLTKNQPREIQPFGVFGGMERLLDEWMKSIWRQPMSLAHGWLPEEIIRVDEYRDNGNLVVRAELPGIDPNKDVELTVTEGMLHIEAQRREEQQVAEGDYVRHELRRGNLVRTLPLPEGISEADIKASYKDGILEIRVPAPEAKARKKIPVSKG